MKKLFKMSLALLMALLMTVMVPVQNFAAAKPLYISEIVMGSYDDLTNNGYTVYDYDINAGNHSSKSVYLGYKTTEDVSEAITDIKMLAQGNGYSVIDSNELFGYFEAEAYEDAIGLYNVLTVFRERYNAGNEAARIAYSALQLFYYDKENKVLLGDYLLNEGTGAAELSDIMLYVNESIQMCLYQLLAFAVYGGQNGDMWLGRYIGGATCQKVDASVKAKSKYILASVKSFQANMSSTWADGIEDASEDGTYTAQDASLSALIMMQSVSYGDKSLLDIFTAEELTAAYFYDMASCMTDADIALIQLMGLENFITMSADGLYDLDTEACRTIQNTLNERDGESALDLFENSSRSENSRVAMTSDMIRDMTINDQTGEFETPVGAIAGIAVGGAVLLAATIVTTVIYKSTSRAAVIAKEMVNSEELLYRVQFAIQRSVTEGGITGSKLFSRISTSEMLAAIKADEIPLLAKTMKFASNLDNTLIPYEGMKVMQMDRILKIIDTDMGAAQAQAFKNLNNLTKAKCLQGIEGSTASVAKATRVAKTAGNALKGSVVLDVIFVLVAIFIALVEINEYYHFMWGSDEYSERPEAVFSLIYDENDIAKYVKYDPAYQINGEDIKTDIGDANGYEGSEWNAIYYTKSLTAGTPIRANTFTNEGGSGKTPLSEFGKTSAHDLNWGAKSPFGGSTSSLYLYYEHTDENTLASIFSSPWGIAIIACAVVIIGGGITAVVVTKKKKKAGSR